MSLITTGGLKARRMYEHSEAITRVVHFSIGLHFAAM